MRVSFTYTGARTVVQVMADAFTVENSKAAKRGNPPEQKVTFKYNGRNVAELEMRNDSKTHYGEVRFNMLKRPCMTLFKEFRPSPFQESLNFSDEVTVYGRACSTFGNWDKPS